LTQAKYCPQVHSADATRAISLALTLCLSPCFSQSANPARWTEEAASAHHARQPWLVGPNYIPSDAINQFRMFQAATFNPAINDRELGLANPSA
jgi:hypothetical protein